jgi:cytochrome c oxidase assembly protein subunit 15
MAILGAAIVLHRRAGEEAPYAPSVPPRLRRLCWAVTTLTATAIATGTVVTGTGPHGGDEHAHRFGFQITSVARVHSGTVMLTVATALALAYFTRRRRQDWSVLGRPLTLFLWLAVLQGAVGYTQYFDNVPVGLVAVHIVGAVSVWSAALLLLLASRQPVASVDDRLERRRRDVALLGVDHLDENPVEPDGVLQVRQVLEP